MCLFLEGSVVITQAGKKIRQVLMLEGAELSPGGVTFMDVKESQALPIMGQCELLGHF